MNLSNNNSYIIDMPHNKVWDITHNKNFGIVYRSLINNQWSTYSSLEKECASSFSTVLLSKNRICLIYQNTNGNICTNIFSNGTWNPKEILRLKGNSFRKVNIKALYHNNKIHLFYSMKLSTSSSETIFYQTLDENHTLSKPIIVDENIVSIKNSFSTSLLDDGSLVILYEKFSNSYTLGYRVLSTSNHTLSNFYTIAKNISPYEDFSLCCNNNTIHVLYVKNMSSKNSLIHCSGYLSDLNYITIFENISKISHPCFFNIGDIIWDMWISNNSLYHCFSKDNGINISHIEQDFLSDNIYKTIYLTFPNDKNYIKNTDNNCLFVNFNNPNNSGYFFPKQLSNSLKSIQSTKSFFCKLNKSSSDIEKYVSTIENKFDYYDKKLTSKDAIINQLNFLLSQEKNKSLSFNSKLAQIKEKFNLLTKEKSKLEVYSDKLTTLNTELKTKISLVENSKIKNYETNINSLNSKIEEYKNTITSLNSKTKEYENIIASLKNSKITEAQITEYENTITSLNSKVVEYENVITSLKNSKISESKITKYENTITSLNSKIVEYENIITSLKNSKMPEPKMTEYENTITSLNSKIAEYENIITSLKNSKITESKMTEYENTITSLNSKITEYDTLINNLNSKLNNIKKSSSEKPSSSFLKKLFKNN